MTAGFIVFKRYKNASLLWMKLFSKFFIEMPSFTLVLLFPFVVVLVYLIVKSNAKYGGLKLPPGPIRWPIVGSIPQLLLIDRKYPHLQMTGLQKTYGNIVSLGFGIHFAIVISSYELMNFILKHPETNNARFRFQFMDQRTNYENLGLGWSWGENLHKLRKFTATKLREVGFGKSRSLEESVREEMDMLMVQMRRESESNDGIWRVDSNPFSVASMNIVWKYVAGYRFDADSPTVKRHLAMNAEIFEILAPRNILSIFPFLKIFPRISGYARHGEIHKRSHQFIQDLIDNAKELRDGRCEAESFVEVFLDEIEKNQGDPNTMMTEKQLRMALMDLFLAGTEGTGASTSWLILYFALHKDIQEKARAEILKFSDGGTKPIPFAENKRMCYVYACILETLRHSPFVGLPVPRQATADITVGEYVIPKDTCLLYNPYAVFHDASYWGDEHVFRPERFFADSQGTSLDQEKVSRIVVFGFGKRACLGEAVATDMLFGFVVALLLNFVVDVVEGNEATLKPAAPTLAIYPAPYSIKLTPVQI